MNDRVCKRCGSVEYGIWGYVGMIGYSLIVGMLGYIVAAFFFSPALPVVVGIFGVCLLMPVWFISYHVERSEIED